MQTHLTLKEKLLQAKSTNNSTVSVQDKVNKYIVWIKITIEINEMTYEID